MTLRDQQGQYITPYKIGDITYEYDYFCLKENSCILTKVDNHISIQKVQDIKDKSLVLSINNKGQQEWKKVYVTKNKAPDSLKQIRSGNLITVTNNHKLFKPGFEIEAAGNITEGDSLLCMSSLELPTTRQSIKITDFIDTNQKWLKFTNDKIGHYAKSPINKDVFVPNEIQLTYDFGLLVGLYLAEGSTAKNLVQFALHLEENELSDIIQNSCNTVFGQDLSTKIDLRPEYTRRIVYIFNKTVWNFFESTLPGDCYNKFIPYWCFDAPKDFKLGLLQGWLFGDGGHGTKTIKGTSSSVELINGILSIALSFGIKTSISKDENNYRLHFCGRENFEKLFPFDVPWKHYQKNKEYCLLENTNKCYTKKQLSEVFLKHYKPNMTKNVFLSKCKMTDKPFLRVFGTWYELLKYHGFEQYAKRKSVSKKELIIIGWYWIQNNEFSESKWNKDKLLPSTGLIVKYFKKSTNFIKALSVLSKKDIEKMELSCDDTSDILHSHNVTFTKNVKCEDEYVYDLSVEDNENFVIGNIVSHNSGSQIGVMIGDVLIDSAAHISFSVQQTKTPVYGYANQYYTFAAAGHVLVQGSLTINFKEAGYLFWPIQRWQEKIGNQYLVNTEEDWNRIHTELWTSPRYSVDENGNKINYYNPNEAGNSLTAAANAAKRKEVMEANVEQMFSWQETADEQRQNRSYNKFWRELGSLPDNEFEDWAETFEDTIWYGSDTANPTTRDKLFSKNLPKTDTISNEQVLGHRRADQYPQIDVWIVYGDMSRQPANHTVRKIMDLEFVGQSQVVEVSGNPIMETYQFIARNVV